MQGSLSSQLVGSVHPQVRRRGGSYYQGGRVRLATCTADEVVASVRGSRRYSVHLRRRGERVESSCSCPYGDGRNEVCKHIWATVLAVDAVRGLRSPEGTLPRLLTVAEPDRSEHERGDDPAAGIPGLEERSEAGSPLPEYRQEDFAFGDGEHSRRPEPGERPPVPWRAPGPPAQPGRPARPHLARAGAAVREPGWRELVDESLASPPSAWSYAGTSLAHGEVLLYLIQPATTIDRGRLMLSVQSARPKKDGGLGRTQRPRITRTAIERLPDPLDRKILALLAGAQSQAAYGSPYEWYEVPTSCAVSMSVAEVIVPLLCATGRCWLDAGVGLPQGKPLAWDGGEPWKLWLAVQETAGGSCQVTALLRRREQEEEVEIALAEPALLLETGLVVTRGRAARLDHGGAFEWISLLRRVGALKVPAADREELVERLLTSFGLPRLELPESLRVEQVQPCPRPRLRLLPPPAGEGPKASPRAELRFRYDDVDVPLGTPGRGAYDRATRRLVLRDRDAESRAVGRLDELGLRLAPESAPGSVLLQVPARRVPEVVQSLLADGWQVEAQGRLYRSAGGSQVSVSSGIDWFEVRGEVDFGGGQTARLPELLAALRRGEGFVPLGDGSIGLLPEQWLKRFAPVAGLGRAEGDHLRFHAAQAALLDAWLAEEPEASWDEAFARARQRLAGFSGVTPAAAPPQFAGELREYQQAGLGWLHFLREIGFGGCLADDMGLGKTVQVLALLAARQAEGAGTASLVVVPRSLLFNWMAEAARFAPGLKVLDFTGASRAREGDPFAGFDLVLTTYGTLRRDVATLRRHEFDYVILDEAQAIKNAGSQTAKAARLLRGRHRLALTGTPVENHLGELWSLLEFLNPGLMGASSVFKAHAAELRDPPPESRALLGRAVRPFLLRRTKEQVAAELPPKLEQTLFCELPAAQRRLYDELRTHYREALGARIGEQGLGRTKILVLEALLRLRQAACHPGLLDRDRAEDPSAKLDLLLPQLREIVEEGHKALVFSQFTSFLGLLRRQLDAEGLPHLYLDGRTRDRRERVERFQTDPASQLFLISLKAGGLGLNLTAADYVYLLDPWWNPAVEAQAIDRAHRIGQTRPVFACRIVARDTVEERILELQKGKRELADAIVQADQSLVAALSREDLELLLS